MLMSVQQSMLDGVLACVLIICYHSTNYNTCKNTSLLYSNPMISCHYIMYHILWSLQKNIKKIRLKKQDVQLQITRAKEIQTEKGLSRDVQDELMKMEAEMENVETTLVQQEEDLKVYTHTHTHNNLKLIAMA